MQIFKLGVLCAWLAAIVGWFINLVDVIQLAAAGSPTTTLFILKAVGILFAPLGAVLGLFW